MYVHACMYVGAPFFIYSTSPFKIHRAAMRSHKKVGKL